MFNYLFYPALLLVACISLCIGEIRMNKKVMKEMQAAHEKEMQNAPAESVTAE